jgi:hypothetical protein
MTPEVDTEPKVPRADLRENAERSVLLPSGARLCLDGARVALFDADPAQSGRWLSSEALVRLDRGVVWHRLELGEQVHALRPGLAKQCLTLLALARLRQRGSAEHAPVRGELDALTQAAVDTVLAPDELLLVAAPTRVRLESNSTALGPVKSRAVLLLSDSRCLLVAVSQAGDVASQELCDVRLEQNDLVASVRRLRLPAAFVPFADCFALGPVDRALEVVRRCFAERSSNGALVRLLEVLAQRGEERAAWVHWFRCLEQDRSCPFPDLLRSPGAVEPAALWRHFGLPVALLDDVFAALPRDEHFDALVVDWATRQWHSDRARTLADAARVASDVVFAERLLRRGQRERARQVADDCLASLQPPQVQQAQLPGSEPLPSVQARLRLHQVRLSTSDDAAERLEQRVRLLRLQPLESAHLRAIADDQGPLARRAERVLDCLMRAAPRDNSDRARRVRSLPADVLERQLRRDVGAVRPALGERMKTWVAKEPRPDAALLRHYCERVTRADAPILRIVDEAATLLGVGHVEIYVSRGDDDVGVRAFEAQRPFVLIGGQHLDESTSYAMTPDELRFAVAAELLHLRVGNVRVGSRDVLRGALHKGRAGLDVALGVLPLFKGLKLVDRLGVVTAKMSLPQVGRALDVGRQAMDGTSPNQAHGLSPAAEKLLATQRASQLWADRVGLLCAGSFVSAVRAIAITRHDTARAARDLAQAGVLEVLAKHRTSDPAAFDYLELRIANLVSFFVSDEYTSLAAPLEPEG